MTSSTKGIDAADIYAALAGRICDLVDLATHLGLTVDSRSRYALLREHLALMERAGWIVSSRGSDGIVRWMHVAPMGRLATDSAPTILWRTTDLWG